MTDTLRNRLAAVLGPGNDDQAAYAQADAVLNVMRQWNAEQMVREFSIRKAAMRL